MRVLFIILQHTLHRLGIRLGANCYVSTARSARLERVLNDGYAVCYAPGIGANWCAVCE
jgi:hypothetical protein